MRDKLKKNGLGPLCSASLLAVALLIGGQKAGACIIFGLGLLASYAAIRSVLWRGRK